VRRWRVTRHAGPSFSAIAVMRIPGSAARCAAARLVDHLGPDVVPEVVQPEAPQLSCRIPDLVAHAPYIDHMTQPRDPPKPERGRDLHGPRSGLRGFHLGIGIGWPWYRHTVVCSRAIVQCQSRRPHARCWRTWSAARCSRHKPSPARRHNEGSGGIKPRSCSVCTHEERPAIDHALVDGHSAHARAARYQLSHDAVSRHKATHVPEHLAKARAAEDVASVGTAGTRGSTN
jgi:hypothetical protein